MTDGECPMCESYGTSVPQTGGGMTCAVCNTSWGGGQEDLSNRLGPSWLPRPPLR
jgi:hypothetical protein